ncbi:MAG: precorrin-8X methylmutase, partial [Methanobrevibacter sp.]|nr:precorrin-8X methylmutase [Methanobrevibacter sp.]
MKIELEQVEPAEIESRSMEIIESELPHEIDPKLAPIIKRAVHTAADFDYVDNLCFSEDVVDKALEAIKNGACIVTDTNMAKAGINKAELKKHGGEVFCFMGDDDVREMAKKNHSTRARASMDKAA